jgi:hypothetical protein
VVEAWILGGEKALKSHLEFLDEEEEVMLHVQICILKDCSCEVWRTDWRGQGWIQGTVLG